VHAGYEEPLLSSDFLPASFVSHTNLFSSNTSLGHGASRLAASITVGRRGRGGTSEERVGTKNHDPRLTAVAEQRAEGMEQSPLGSVPFLVLILSLPSLLALSHHWQEIWEPLGYEFTHKHTIPPETRCEVTQAANLRI